MYGYEYVFVYMYMYVYVYAYVHASTCRYTQWIVVMNGMGLLVNFLQSICTTVLNHPSICNFDNKTSYSIYYFPCYYLFQRLYIAQEELVSSQFNGNSVKKSFKPLSLCIFVSTNLLLPIAILFKPCVEGEECGEELLPNNVLDFCHSPNHLFLWRNKTQ